MLCAGQTTRSLVAVLMAGAALAVGDASAVPALTDPTLAVTTVASGLATPTSMAFLAPNDILVLEKDTGKVRRVLGGVLQPAAVLDVNVNGQSERGLLGIAINDQSPPNVFLYFTEAQGADGGTPLGNRVYRYTWNGTTLVSPQRILDLPVLTGPNHNGGFVLLGPPEAGLAGDGRPLYVVIGDVNHNGQLQNQPTGTPDDSGVIFRVQQDGSPHPLNPFFGYCSATPSTTCTAPADCPAGQTCVSQVARYYAYGVRNSFGLALDPRTGALWDTENGPALFDEVNRVAPGFNSGWNQIMGPDARDPQGPADLFDMPGSGSTYSDPEFSWQDTVAPTAILFPVGSVLGAAYDDVALVADANLGNLYRLRLNPSRTAFDFSGVAALQDRVADNQAEADLMRIGAGFNGIVDLDLGPDGAVYVLSIGDGTIFRIDDAPPTTGLTCFGWRVTIRGTNASETIRGTTGNDVIHGLGGNDTIHGLGGNDVICGGSGNETIYGDAGDDRISGEAGSDRVFAGSGDDFVEGGAGDDTLQGEDGNDRLTGGLDDDLLEDTKGTNSLNGGAGSDRCLIGQTASTMVGCNP